MSESIWQTIVLGALQGLTEFLPISSSAHLILLPWFLGWESMGLVFDVVLHAGTLISVLLYFHSDWRMLAVGLWNRVRGTAIEAEKNLVDALLLGTIPAMIVGLIFHTYIEHHARKPLVTVVTLSSFALLLLWADRKGKGDRPWSSVSRRHGVIIGLAQALALIPGVSRSGITMTAALLLGFSRGDSARFSFLLAGPVIFMGAVDGLLQLLLQGGGAEGQLLTLLVGVTVSFLVGFLCIKYFLKFLENCTFLPFVVYRILLALVILSVWIL